MMTYGRKPLNASNLRRKLMQYLPAGLRRMRAAPIMLAATALLAGLVTFSIVGSALAAGGIMLHIEDVPLKVAVSLLTQQSGVNIVIVDESNLDKKITASLTDVPLDTALDYVVKSAGVSYRKMPDGTYIIGGSATDELPALSPSDVASLLPPVMMGPVEKPKESIITTVKLIYSKPSELLKLIGWNGSNPMANCEVKLPQRLGGSAESITTNPGGGVFYNMPPSVSVTTPADGAVRIENNQPVAPMFDPRGNTDAGRTADVYTGAGQQYTIPGRPSGYPPVSGANIGNRPGTTPTTTTTTANSQGFLWPEGVEQAQPFDLDNSIIVKGDEDGIEKFKKIVRMLDVAPKQVEIKAEFIEVTTKEVKKLGIDWSLQRLNESFDTSFGITGNVIVGFAAGNLTAQLRAELTNNIGRVINSPIISTINNQNAYISINQQIPYWVSTNVISGDQTVQQYSPQFINIDTNLNVLPRVNGDNTITMILSPRVSDTGNVFVGPDNSSIPETRNQELFTQRRVRDGETIVVGGFIRKNDSNGTQKVPILGDLPIIGGLFRTATKAREDRELLIFITPRILPDTSGGTVGSAPTL